jgi:hypothetical protein
MSKKMSSDDVNVPARPVESNAKVVVPVLAVPLSGNVPRSDTNDQGSREAAAVFDATNQRRLPGRKSPTK